MNLLSIYFLQIKLDGNYFPKNSGSFQEAGMQIIPLCMSQILKAVPPMSFLPQRLLDRIVSSSMEGMAFEETLYE
jgi:hypothetical protein